MSDIHISRLIKKSIRPLSYIGVCATALITVVTFTNAQEKKEPFKVVDFASADACVGDTGYNGDMFGGGDDSSRGGPNSPGGGDGGTGTECD